MNPARYQEIGEPEIELANLFSAPSGFFQTSEINSSHPKEIETMKNATSKSLRGLTALAAIFALSMMLA
ncbi:MAG TPA: hypothetical protein VIT19_05915, partial [Pyrinomonadaceae bacterium]